MHVLIADKFEAFGIDSLKSFGFRVTYDPKLNESTLGAALASSAADVMVVRGTKVPAAALESAPRLGLIVRAGAGFNTIDVATASRLGIYVSNCPGKNAVAVAELTIGLILAIDRRIVDNVVDLRNGVWNKKEYSNARGLKDRFLGLIGFGQIGQEVARRARSFDMKVAAWSRSLTRELADRQGVVWCANPEEVAARCDILSIHLAAAPETRGLVGPGVIQRLAPGSYVINTARGDVMDYAALAAAVAERGLRVGLDVYAQEPAEGTGEFKDAIVRAGGVVYGTHHIGASTDQAQTAIAEETVRIIRTYGETGDVPNCVNLCRRSPAKRLLVVRHLNKPGVLAHVLGEIGRAGINVEEMENLIFANAQAACARIRLDDAPAPEVMQRVRSGCEHILSLSLVDLPA